MSEKYEIKTINGDEYIHLPPSKWEVGDIFIWSEYHTTSFPIIDLKISDYAQLKTLTKEGTRLYLFSMQDKLWILN